MFHLHKLDIIDKHRLLLAVAGRNPTHTMSPSEIASYKRALGIEDDFVVQGGDAVVFQTDSPSPFPLKTGERTLESPYIGSKRGDALPLCDSVRRIWASDGKPVIPTLYNMAQSIRSILHAFDKKGILR